MGLFGIIKGVGKGLFPKGTVLGNVFGSTRKKGSGAFGTGIGIGKKKFQKTDASTQAAAPRPAPKDIVPPETKKDPPYLLYGLGALLIIVSFMAFKD